MRKLILFLLLLTVSKTTTAQEDAIPITVHNAHQLELGYILPDSYCAFSPNGKLLYTTQGIYDAVSGQVVFSPDDYHSGGDFSQDNMMFAMRGGVYDTNTWQLMFPLPEDIFSATFSPDNKLMAVTGNEQMSGVYETATWEKRFGLLEDGLGAIFSPDSRWLAVSGSGVYDAATGEKVVDGIGFINDFSPDGTMMAGWTDAVYQTGTWAKLFHIRGGGYFSTDSRLIRVTHDGVYNTATGAYNIANIASFSDDGGEVAFSPDSRMVAYGDGSYVVKDTLTGEVLFYTDSAYPVFSPDSSLLLSATGLYSTSNGLLVYELPFSSHLPHPFFMFNADSTLLALNPPQFNGDLFCAIYGLAGTNWQYRSGLVRLNPSGIYAVYATNPDRTSLRIGEEVWVDTAEVEIITLPDEIPIENS